MSINIIKIDTTPAMEPLTCNRMLHEIPINGIELGALIESRITKILGDSQWTISIKTNLWPSESLIQKLLKAPTIVKNQDGEQLAWSSNDIECPDSVIPIVLDKSSFEIKYPWHILQISEGLTALLSEDKIEGTVRDGAVLDGHIELGEGSVILPGVYIEGNVIIGKNCKIGPNCYIRGNSYIGNECHVGQSVEIKNSLLMDKVSVGHLSYIGDSVICPHTNIGAGTITANFRHDGKNHKSVIGDELLDTGRRKLGMICGDNVHTGINTSVYPGRKIWTDLSTRPGDIVQRDLKPFEDKS